MGERRKEVAEPLTEAAQTMTIHGLPRVLQDDVKYIKVIWFLIFIVAFSSLAILISDRVNQYYKYEVYLKAKSTIMQPLPFPAITVCNSDRFSFNKVAKIPTRNISCNAAHNSTRAATLSPAQRKELKKACKMFLSGYKDTIRFGGEEIPGFPVNFTYTGLFAPCFTFNKNGQANQEVSGGGNGLDMILFNDPNDAIDFSITNKSRFDDKRRGLIIQIHDPETTPSIDPDTGIAVLPGFAHEIVLSRKTFSRRPSPFPSNCHTTKTAPYRMQQGRYTIINCFIACLETKLLEQCGIVPGHNKSKLQAECESKLLQKKPIGDCACPQPCYEITYPMKVVINIWPGRRELTRMTTEFAALLNLSQTSIISYTQTRFSKVKIYYEKLINTDATEEELYGLASLTSEIGGLTGLFLGCSVISVVELLWLFGLSVKSICKCIGFGQRNVQMAEITGQPVELGSTNGTIYNNP